MANYCVIESVDDNYGRNHVQCFKTRPSADALLDTRRRAGCFARLMLWDGDEPPVELAHVRNGVLYEGLSSQIDWADTLQVVEVWERAKQEIRERLDGPKTGPEFLQIIEGVVETRGLPGGWVSRLRDALRAESEPQTPFLV